MSFAFNLLGGNSTEPSKKPCRCGGELKILAVTQSRNGNDIIWKCQGKCKTFEFEKKGNDFKIQIDEKFIRDEYKNRKSFTLKTV